MSSQSQKGLWICLLVIGLVAAGVCTLFLVLGTELMDRISSGIGAGAGVVAVVFSLIALFRRPSEVTTPASAAVPPATVGMHANATDNAQVNMLGQGVQNIFRDGQGR